MSYVGEGGGGLDDEGLEENEVMEEGGGPQGMGMGGGGGAGGGEGLSLPKATVTKLIKELVPANMRCPTDTRDLMLDCCVEFIHLVATQANDAACKTNKKTISGPHVLEALKELGFDQYIGQATLTYGQHREGQADKPKGRKGKMASKGVSEEELEREQEACFDKAQAAFEGRQGLTLS
ncbi:negative cofactor 2 transcription regulator complex subunit ncb2 [Pelomyxa schiedti]|nr:negative cofactor 2 transcription regulator complex subunit ncb2 [Pelomyxa schiedti]